MKTGRLLAIALLASVAVLGGCRNPFNPAAQIRFDRFYAGAAATPILSIQQSQAGTMKSSPTSAGDLVTLVQISNTSTVPGRITGYNVVYRQISDGQPIAACGGAAGRRFQTHIAVSYLQSNYSAEAITYPLPFITIVTDELLNHIATNLTTIDGGIDCEVTFYGEDDNGYDIQVEGVLHIDVL